MNRLLRYICTALVVVPAMQASAQTNISGVINSYAKVTEVISAKACMRVSPISALQVFATVMIVQAKGADINTTNNSGFGTVTAYNGAGDYELNYVCGIRGDSVFFVHDFTKTYSAASKLQLVNVPVYDQALVTDTLKPGPWNNAEGTGGVLALIANDVLTLNAPIYADTSGFSGGSFKLLNGAYTLCNIVNNTNYSYNTYTTNEQAAFKGQGIAEPLSNSYSGGRGPMASGGGGGNDHNNGGGGGSNLAAGGNGGENTSTTGCRNKAPGLGGKALNSSSGTKLFFGGGGGAGHANGVTQSWGGGNGGGIVYIKANEIKGNGYSISANGGVGSPGAGDGAGGGGAGGTIIMEVAAYTGSLTIAAKGGKGGDTDNGSATNRCYGSGGGGSGGVIYFSGTTPAVTTQVTGGNNGVSFNSFPVSCDGSTNATTGATGLVSAGYTVVKASLPAGYCSVIALPVSIVSFTASPEGNAVQIKATIVHAETARRFIIQRSTDGILWTGIHTIYGTTASTYALQFSDTGKRRPTVYYRLKVELPGGMEKFSSVVVLRRPFQQTIFSIYPNPAKDRIEIRSHFTGQTHIELVNTQGQRILHHSFTLSGNRLLLFLPSLQPGLYYLRVNGTVEKLLIE
jgi:Secretion system C-terminal sorting domain